MVMCVGTLVIRNAPLIQSLQPTGATATIKPFTTHAAASMVEVWDRHGKSTFDLHVVRRSEPDPSPSRSNDRFEEIRIQIWASVNIIF